MGSTIVATFFLIICTLGLGYRAFLDKSYTDNIIMNTIGITLQIIIITSILTYIYKYIIIFIFVVIPSIIIGSFYLAIFLGGIFLALFIALVISSYFDHHSIKSISNTLTKNTLSMSNFEEKFTYHKVEHLPK